MIKNQHREVSMRNPRQKVTSAISLITTLALLWTLLIPVLPVQKASANPSSTKIQDNRKEKVELSEYRTSNSKRFLNPDGTLTEEVYLGNVHYKKGNEWLEMDNSFVKTEGEFQFKNKANRYETQFTDHTNGNHFIRFAVGESAVEIRPVGLLTSAAKAQGNKIRFSKGSGANGPPIALEYTLGTDSLKEDIILDQ
jgi:hypothetical protein